MLLFGRKRETALADLTLPDGNNAVLTFERDGLPGVVVVDRSLRRIMGHSELPVRLGIALEFLDRRSPQGLPSREEDQDLTKLDDDIQLLLNGPPRRGFMAMRITSSWVREWMAYVTDAKTGTAIAENIQFRYPAYHVTHYAQLDKRWEGFRRFGGK